MPRLEEKMKKASEQAADQLPDEALEITGRHTRELVDSDITEEAVGEGDRAPDFRLPSAAGREVQLSDLLARGPVVLSFYRGRW